MRFVLAVEAGDEPVAALCRASGISRRIGYKWLTRYQETGVAGLADRSRAPLGHPQAMPAALAERCLAARRAHPTWGPAKVRAWLRRHEPALPWPAASTIGALFDREGLTVKRKARRRAPSRTQPFAACTAANDVWCIDFKGWFLTGDGTHCEPLTLSDADSRYLLRCQALGRNDTEHVWPILDAAFREYGLPLALRSDNGPPADHYSPSPRSWDGVLRAPAYPDDHELRRVRHSGEIKWRGNSIYISQALAGEPVGLQDTDDGGWTVRYGPIDLGVIDHRADRLRRPKPSAGGLVDNPGGLPTIPPAQPPQQDA